MQTEKVTTVIVDVRQDSPEFHGVVAHIAIQGIDQPELFATAMRLAMLQTGVLERPPGLALQH